MGDVFLEQLVKKRLSITEKILKVLILALGVLVFIFSFTLIGAPMIGSFVLLFGVGAIYFAWFFATGLNLEFEYIYTNGEIDIDKITAKRKRKRMITVRISSFDAFDKYDVEKSKSQKYDVTYFAAESANDPDTYYATFRNRDGKSCILIFTPNEKLLDAINVQYRRKSYAR